MNGKNEHLVEAFTFFPYQVWPEQELRGTKAGRADLQGEKSAQRGEDSGVVQFAVYSLEIVSFSLRSNFRETKLFGYSCYIISSQMATISTYFWQRCHFYSADERDEEICSAPYSWSMAEK